MDSIASNNFPVLKIFQEIVVRTFSKSNFREFDHHCERRKTCTFCFSVLLTLLFNYDYGQLKKGKSTE